MPTSQHKPRSVKFEGRSLKIKTWRLFRSSLMRPILGFFVGLLFQLFLPMIISHGAIYGLVIHCILSIFEL